MEKTERFGFWLTTSEKEILSRLAELEGGLSRAALIRRLVREAGQKYNIISATTINVLNDPKGMIDE